MIRFVLRLPLSCLPLLVLLLVLPACAGVSLREPGDEGELFKDISLAGERLAGKQLTVTISVSQGYPVPVRVACYFENPSKLTPAQLQLPREERATKIGETLLPAKQGGIPKEGGELQQLNYAFAVPEAGDYLLLCSTPAAPDNRMRLRFRVEG
jgi:hypothetical protein